jgi:hypothetical protein
MTNINLRKFDPSKMQENRRVVIIGKSGVGKTQCLMDIMYHKRHIPCGTVLSGTEEGNSFYQQYVPDLYVHAGYDEDVVTEVLKRQKRLTRKKAANRGAFLILDDCAYDKKILKGPLIREIFMNSRHFALFTVLTLQFCMDMPTDLRTNVDYVFICRENILSNRKRLYESFCGMFKTFNEFCRVMDACTQNYEVLVVDNTSTSNAIEDCIFWYKAVMRPPFKIGCKEFWSVHKKRYNAKYYEEEDGSRTRKRNNVTVTKVK